MSVKPEILQKLNRLLGLLLGVFLYFSSDAQTIYENYTIGGTIKGMVIDSVTKAKLGHVTVEVYEAKKNTAIRTLLTDEHGFFATSDLPAHNQFSISFSSIGYETLKLQVPSFTTSSVHLGQIALVSIAKELREIQVTSQRPILEQSLDKLTYNVEADPESRTASALDILRKVPLLSLDAEDNLQLNGNSNYRILINGKSSSLFLSNQADMFKNLSASAIKTIEVITVPPSKYEAAGVGGIINITTYKRNIGGYNGGIDVRVSDPEGLSTNSNLSFKLGKFSLAGSFGYSKSTNPDNRNTLTRLDKTQQSRLEQSGASHSQNRSQNASGEMSYELRERNLFTVGYSTNRARGNNHYNQQVALYNHLNEPTEAYRRQSEGGNTQQGNDLSVDYQRNFKRNDEQQLKLSYKRSYNTSDNNHYFIQQPLMAYKSDASTSNNVDDLTEHTLQADYIQPLKKHTLELGASAIRRQNTSDYFYKHQDSATGAFVLDTAHSNNFLYREDIYAGYTSLNLRMGKWGVKMGGRLELARIDARFISSHTQAIQDFENLVPSITISRRLKNVSTLRLSYTQRLQRPSLYYLDPYIDQTDPWNISYGNPALQPALAQLFNLGYNTFLKKTAIHINILHQYTNNAIQQFTKLDADTIARTTYANIGRNRTTSLSLSLNSNFFKILGINLNTNANFIEYNSTIDGKMRSSEGLTYTITGGANLRLKTWRLAGNMSYNAPNVLTQGRTAAYSSNSATLNKYFLKNNKANIGLSASSLFREHRRSSTEIDDPAFYLWRESFSVIRRYHLSFNYRFVKVQGSSENVRREK